MRSPDPFSAPSHVESDGSHIAATLYRLAHGRRDDRPQLANPDPISQTPAEVYASVAAQAAALTDVRGVEVRPDERRELFTLYAQVGDGQIVPASAISDGTLRFLALCVIERDSNSAGLICMEEPENGIHPARIKQMAQLVRDLAVDPTVEIETDNIFRQVMVNTHSSTFVEHQDPDDLLYARRIPVIRDGRRTETVRLYPLAKTWRAVRAEFVTKDSLIAYLESDPEAQLRLALESV